MKSLQNKYNLIKEGKGSKELFLKEARATFPNIVTGALTFDQAIHHLSERGIISEGITGVLVQRANEPNWFKIFNENTEKVKSNLKKPDKSVEEKEIAGYDYEDKSNNNNISTAEILKGYYAEMKDPKNADKTEEELKKIVFKNLEKDPMYYIKDGAFGIKGIGYTEDHPGLGPTKEVTGKYKSSGMEPVKLNESKKPSSGLTKKEKSTIAKKAKAGKDIGEKGKGFEKIAKTASKEYGSKEAGQKVAAAAMWKNAAHKKAVSETEETPKKKILPNKQKGIADQVEIKSGLEKVIRSVYAEKDLKAAKEIVLSFLKTSKINSASKAKMTQKVEDAKTKHALDSYLTNALLRFEKLSVNEGLEQNKLKEGYGSTLTDAMNKAYQESLNGYVQHVEDNGDGTFSVSDWYDGDKTVVSFEDGRKFNDKTADYELGETDITGIAGSEDEEEYKQGTRGIKKESMNILSEAKKRAIEKHLKEIEKLGEVAAYEYKANKVQEKIEELKNKLAMTESEDMKEMVDKNTVKEIKKDIAVLEKKKKMYEAQKAKAAKRVSGDGVKPKAAGGEEIIDEAKEKKPVWQEAMRSVLKKKGY